MFVLDDQNVYRAASLEQFAWLEHGFGTRLSNGWPDMSRMVTPKQIHSNKVLVATAEAPPGPAARLGQGDAVVSAERQFIVGIRTADCLPILLVDPSTRAVAAIHAGWRGTVSDISRHTIGTMMCQFGTRPADVWAAIGPGIGPCCFEVGPEVAAQFKPIFPDRVDLNHRTYIDLAEANQSQLLAAGVPAGQIELSGLCTVCQTGEFYSYRKEKEQAGRMISGVGYR